MEKGYYWARWIYKDHDNRVDDKWEIIEVESDNFICRIGDDEIWDISYFEFGDRIPDKL